MNRGTRISRGNIIGRKPAALSGRAPTFLLLFRPGAILTLRPGSDIPLSSFGDSLESIGNAIDAIPDLCRSLGLSLSGVAVADIQDEEFARTARFLEALLLKGIPLGQLANGFIVGPAAELPREQVRPNLFLSPCQSS